MHRFCTIDGGLSGFASQEEKQQQLFFFLLFFLLKPIKSEIMHMSSWNRGRADAGCRTGGAVVQYVGAMEREHMVSEFSREYHVFLLEEPPGHPRRACGSIMFGRKERGSVYCTVVLHVLYYSMCQLGHDGS